MTTVAAKRRKPSRRNRSAATAAAFVMPGYFFYVAFLLVPLVLTVVLSFTSWNGFSYNQIQFNGIDNYVQLTRDPVFLQSLLHNVIFLVASVILKLVLSFAVAVALRSAFPLAGFFRGVVLIPATLSLVVLGIVVKFILDPNNGLINPLLRSIGLGSLAGTWLADPSKALPILILLDVWVGFGLYVFIFLASMAALPGDIFDAAKVDGAQPWQVTAYVTIPMLADTIKLVLLLGAIDSLKVFATVYVTTGGGPNHASEVLSTWAFFQAFSGNQVGYGSAILVVLLVVTLLLAFLYTRHSGKDAEDRL